MSLLSYFLVPLQLSLEEMFVNSPRPSELPKKCFFFAQIFRQYNCHIFLIEIKLTNICFWFVCLPFFEWTINYFVCCCFWEVCEKSSPLLLNVIKFSSSLTIVVIAVFVVAWYLLFLIRIAAAAVICSLLVGWCALLLCSPLSLLVFGGIVVNLVVDFFIWCCHCWPSLSFANVQINCLWWIFKVLSKLALRKAYLK